jgi:hypothetical protein
MLYRVTCCRFLDRPELENSSLGWGRETETDDEKSKCTDAQIAFILR